MALGDGIPAVEPGLWQWAQVTAVISATQFQAARLAGYGDTYFNGWGVYVLRKASGTGAAPQGETQGVTTFVKLKGTVTHTAFTALLSVGDEILMILPDIGALYRQLFSMDFWSEYQALVQLGAAQATLALPNVTVANLPAGATIVMAIALFKARMVENTNVAANKLNGSTVAGTSQVIQVRDAAPGTWRDAINLVDDTFGLAASTRESGDVFIGQVNIAVEVNANKIYNFRWLLSRADLNNLNLNDVQVGLRIWYSV